MIALWTLVVRLIRGMRRGLSEPEFRGLLYSVTVVIASGTFFYRAVEGWNVIDSFYFTVITLTTVGYGDLAPSTSGSRLFTVMLVLLGIGLLVTFVERVARYSIEDDAARRSKRSND